MAPFASTKAEFSPQQEATTAEHTSGHFAACAPTMAVPSVMIVGAAVVGHGDDLVDGVTTVVNGVPVRNPTVAALMTTFGMSFEQATQAEGWIEAGASIVEAGGGLVVAVKSGTVVGTTRVTPVRTGDVATNTELFRMDDLAGAFDNPEQFARIRSALDRQGVNVIIPDGQADDTLRFMEYAGVQGSLRRNADGSYDLTLRPDAGPSAVYEELIHLGQYRSRRFDQWQDAYGTSGAVARAEYEAANRLVQNRSQYGTPDSEHQINLQRVQDFANDLDRLGVPYD